MRITKKDIYAEYGIEYRDGRINAPLFGWIPVLLIDGNVKLGHGVWTWSMLPGTDKVTIDGMDICGTCACDCPGCYAKTGNYRYPDNIAGNARKAALARLYLDWTKRAIAAQIHADKIKLCRIHAAGDFFSVGYVNAWKWIASECPDTTFWTYTKFPAAENAFDQISNVNVVKSLIPGHGMNYGHCDYILNTYHALKKAGKSVHICRCGFDKDQHCNTCKGCSEHEYVLFVEHSTGYRAEKDPMFSELAKIANA